MNLKGGAGEGGGRGLFQVASRTKEASYPVSVQLITRTEHMAHEQKCLKRFYSRQIVLSSYTNRNLENTTDSCKYIPTENQQVGTA